MTQWLSYEWSLCFSFSLINEMNTNSKFENLQLQNFDLEHRTWVCPSVPELLYQVFLKIKSSRPNWFNKAIEIVNKASYNQCSLSFINVHSPQSEFWSAESHNQNHWIKVKDFASAVWDLSQNKFLSLMGPW